MGDGHFRPVQNQPYLFRRNGVYYFRRTIPKELRGKLGRAEVQRSLRTTSLSEARRQWSIALSDFEQLLAGAVEVVARREVTPAPTLRTPSKQEIEEATREWLALRMSRATIPSGTEADPISLAQARTTELDAQLGDTERGTKFAAARPTLMMAWIADDLIERKRWKLEEGSELRRYLMTVIGRGQAEAIRQQRQDLTGAPRTITDQTFAPELYRTDAERTRERAGDVTVTLWTLFEGYVAESKPAPATEKAWKRFIMAFTDFVGTDDAARVRFQDVLRWKEHLLAKPVRGGGTLSPKTVRDTYLAALKTVFRWGVENNRLQSNPAAQVRVRSRKKGRLRNPDFSDAEAIAILKATKLTPPLGLSVERARARRWVPWLCAYSGARVAEITQMRAEDVQRTGDVWTIRITPEAGSTKTGHARVIALHPDIIRQGFLDAISGLSGPLFYDPSRRREGSSAAHPQAKKVGQHLADWVRSVAGVTDPRVAPNHGWRHRFKTIARSVGMDPETRDYIQGHVPRTEGETYGAVAPEVTLREIKKLPAYRV